MISLAAGVALGLFLAFIGATALLLFLDIREERRETRARRSPVQQRATARRIHRSGGGA